MLRWVLSAGIAIGVIAVAAAFAFSGGDGALADDSGGGLAAGTCLAGAPDCGDIGVTADGTTGDLAPTGGDLPLSSGACAPTHPDCGDMVAIDEDGTSKDAPLIGDLPVDSE